METLPQGCVSDNVCQNAVKSSDGKAIITKSLPKPARN
jgi:hypothetical protein